MAIEVKKNTLVIIMPRGKPPNPPHACWAMVIQRFDSGNCQVLIGPEPHNEIFAFPDQIIPVLQTDGSFKNPQRIFPEHEPEIVLHLLMAFLTQQGVVPATGVGPAALPEPVSVIPIQENTLVIVLEKASNPPETCWGLVLGQLIGGNYEVQIGRFRLLKSSRIVVQPGQLIPVYLTDGTFKSPRHAVRTLRAQLFLHLFLMFQSGAAADFLRQLGSALLGSNFVLLSRKAKTPPPKKKPEPPTPESPKPE